MKLKYLSVMVLVAAGGGCGGGDPVEVDEISAAYADVICSHYARCCTADEFMEVGADEAECRAAFAGLFDGYMLPALEDSIAAGRVVYDPVRMGACLDAIRQRTCQEGIDVELARDDVGCEDPFDGQVALGGPCANNFDCVQDYCSGERIDSEGNITLGVCATLPEIGEPCDDFVCASGAYCDTSSSPSICQALLADGSACTDDDDCASGGCDGEVCGARTTCDGN